MRSLLYIGIAFVSLESCRGDFANSTEPLPTNMRLDYARLRKAVLGTKEDNGVRPVLNVSKPVEVKVMLTLQQIIELNMKEEILVTNSWLTLNWKDEYLVWEPASYGNIKSIRLNPDQLWVPDIFAYNSVDNFGKQLLESYVKMHVSSSGDVIWVVPVKLKTTCKIDTVNPTNQICNLKFGSWTYNGNEVTLKLDNAEVDTSSYVTNKQWDLVSAEAKRHETYYECCPEAYEDITFSIKLKAKGFCAA